jgi:acyl-CoA synthetase (AMP-forming)/AMP-acid ligase II
LQGIHWWVRKWADLRGASPAVTCDGAVVTWGELDRRVDVLASHLDFLGVGAGDRVGCLMPNCVEFIMALHAASRIGAIFVSFRPLSSTSGPRRCAGGSPARRLTR